MAGSQTRETNDAARDVEKAVENSASRPNAESDGAETTDGVDSATISPEDENEPPDRGWEAWASIIPSHVATVMTWGYGTGFAVFELYYKQNTNWSLSQISWIGSTELFLYFVLGMISGRMSDAGYTRHLYFVGSVLAVLGMFMTSLCKEYWQFFLAQGICSGIGGGLMFMPALAVVGTYFKKKRALAMSLNACGSSTGAIIFPAIVQYSTPKVGFPCAVRICGFVALFLSILGNLLLRPRKIVRHSAPVIDWEAFKDTTFLIFSTSAFLVFFAVFTLLIYVNSYAKEIIGLSDVESINFVFITNALAVVARPVFGFVADRFLGPINTFSMNSIGLGIMAFAWTGVHNRAAMYAYSCVLGFVNGACQGVFPGATGSLVKDVSKMGTWFGMIFAICGLATLAGPPAMGAIIDASGGKFTWAQIWAGIVILLGSVMALTTSYLVSKRRPEDTRKKLLGVFYKA